MQIFRRKIKKKKKNSSEKLIILPNITGRFRIRGWSWDFPRQSSNHAVLSTQVRKVQSRGGAAQVIGRSEGKGDVKAGGKEHSRSKGQGGCCLVWVSSYPRGTSWEYTEGAFPTHGALVTVVAQKTSTRREMTKMESASSFHNVSIP